MTRADARMIAEELYRLMQQDKDEDLIDVQAAARFLGCAAQTVYNLVSRGDIPSHKSGRSRRFKLSELKDYRQSKERR